MNARRVLKLACGLALSAAVVWLAPGCGDDDGGDDNGQALSVAGQWTLAAAGMFPMTLNLAHAGTVVGGTITDAENYAVRVAGSTASPAGTTEGARGVTLMVTFSDGQVATFTGVVSGDNNTMSGAYSSNWGGADSWSAVRL